MHVLHVLTIWVSRWRSHRYPLWTRGVWRRFLWSSLWWLMWGSSSVRPPDGWLFAVCLHRSSRNRCSRYGRWHLGLRLRYGRRDSRMPRLLQPLRSSLWRSMRWSGCRPVRNRPCLLCIELWGGPEKEPSPFCFLPVRALPHFQLPVHDGRRYDQFTFPPRSPI